MKRDMDIVRSVLAEVEALTPEQCDVAEYPVRLGMPPEEYARGWHLLMLQEAGFVRGLRADNSRGQCLVSPELTWQGAELADLVRERTFYERIKTEVANRGLPLTIDAVVTAGKSLIAASLG